MNEEYYRLKHGKPEQLTTNEQLLASNSSWEILHIGRDPEAVAVKDATATTTKLTLVSQSARFQHEVFIRANVANVNNGFFRKVLEHANSLK